MINIKFKTPSKRIYFFAVAWMLSVHISAITFTIGDLSYGTSTDSTVYVMNGTPTGELVIPTQVEYDGNIYSVITIGNDAFKNCKELTKVTVPNSVTSIQKYAFYGCIGLTEITIGNSVTSIGESAFQGCTKLTEITIPNSVITIGNYAFESCRSLTSVTIGNSVKSIGNHAFRRCWELTKITIPDSVTSIGEFAFYFCTELTEVTIGKSVTTIGNYAFRDCSELTKIYCYIEEPLTIDSDVFLNVQKNTCTLYVPTGSKEKYQAKNVWNEFLNIVEFDVTGIEHIEHSPLTNNRYYTIDGKLLNEKPTKTGIYIVNGVKVVIN